MLRSGIVTNSYVDSLEARHRLYVLLVGISMFLASALMIFAKYYKTGKKYAQGAKKRRRSYLGALYGRDSIFKRERHEVH